MKLSTWFSCRSQPPVRNGEYEIRRWFHNGYEPSRRRRFGNGMWFAVGSGVRMTGTAAPGWGFMDQWRGVLKGKK